MNPNEPLIQPTASEPINPTPPAEPVPPVAQSMEFVSPPPENPVAMEQPIQMPPYAPTQPPMAASSPESVASNLPVMPTPPSEQIASKVHGKKDLLGIISILCVFVAPIGLVLGLIGASRTKKSQRSPVLSRIGWILSLVVMLVAVPLVVLQIMSNMEAAEVKARDTERAKDLGAIETELEEYFAENFGYPNDLDELDFTDEQVLIGPSGSTIKVNDVASDEDEAKGSTDPTSSVEYTYTPYGKPACLSTCDGYVLKGFVESPTKGVTNPLIKFGLENL